MLPYSFIIGAGLAGVAIGGLRPWAAAAPWLASGLALAAYGVLLATAGSWAAQCWDCTYGYEDTRSFVFAVWAVLGAAMAGALVLGAWIGAALSTLVRRAAR